MPNGSGIECPPCKLLLCSGGEVIGSAQYLAATAQALNNVVLQRSIMEQPITAQERDALVPVLMKMGEKLKAMNEELEKATGKLFAGGYVHG